MQHNKDAKEYPIGANVDAAPESKQSFSISELEKFNFLQILNDLYSELSSKESKDTYSPSLDTINKSIELLREIKHKWENLDPYFDEPKSKKLLLDSKISQSLTPEILKALFILNINQDLLANMNPNSQYDKWPLFKIFHSVLSEGLTALKLKPIIKTNFDQSQLELDTDFPKQKENYAQTFPNIGNTLLELAKSLGINIDQPKYRKEPNNKSLDDQLNKIIDKMTKLDSLKLSAEKKETENFTSSREQKRIATASKLSILKALNASLNNPVIFNTYDTTVSTNDETAIREQLQKTPLNKLVINFLQNIDKIDVQTLHLLFDSDNLDYLIKGKEKFTIDGKEYSTLDFIKEVIKTAQKSESHYEQLNLAIELLDAKLTEQLRIASELKPSSTEEKSSPISQPTEEGEYFKEEKEHKIQLNKELEALDDARCDIIYTKNDPTKNPQDLKFTNYSNKAFIRFEDNNKIQKLYYYDCTKNRLIDIAKEIDLEQFDKYIRINKVFKNDNDDEKSETAEIIYEQPKMLRKPVFGGLLEMRVNENFTLDLPAPSILLIATNDVMAQLMTNKGKSGYETSLRGVCRGLSQMWTAAVLQGEEEKYNDRLQFINDLVYKKLIEQHHKYGELLKMRHNDKYANDNWSLDVKQDRVAPIHFSAITAVYNDIQTKSRESQKKYLELETKIKNSEEFKTLSLEEKNEITKSDKYHSWIYNQLTPEEQQYYEMVPFLDSVALHQNPAILNKKFNQAGNVSLHEKYLSLTKGRKLKEEDIVAIYSQPNIYKPEELENYLKQLHLQFNSIKEELKDKENTQTTINLESETHSISLKYNPKTDDWTIADPNRMPPYTVKIEDLTAAIIRDLIIFKDNNELENVRCTIYTTTNNPMLEKINKTFTAFKADTKFPTNILQRTVYGSKIVNDERVIDYSVHSNLLMDAIQYDDIATIKQLMEQAKNFGIDFNKRQLLFSVIFKDLNMLKLFLEKKDELNLNLDLLHQDRNGPYYTALSYLVLQKKPDFEKIAALINAGADIWKHDPNSSPPFVSLAGNPKALIQFANLIKPDNAGNTLLHNAVCYAISANKYHLYGTSERKFDEESQTYKTIIDENISNLYDPNAILAIISLISSEGKLFDKILDPTHSEYFKKASSLLYQENNKGLKPLDLASEDFLRRFIDEIIVYKPILAAKADENIEIEKISLDERVNKIKSFASLAAQNGDIKLLKAILDHEHKDEEHPLAKLKDVNEQQILHDILNSSLEIAIKNGQTDLAQWISQNVKNYLEGDFLNKFANLDSAIEESRKNKDLLKTKSTQDKKNYTESKAEEKLSNLDAIPAENKSESLKLKELAEKKEKSKAIRESAEKKLEKLFSKGVNQMETKPPEPSTKETAAAKIGEEDALKAAKAAAETEAREAVEKAAAETKAAQEAFKLAEEKALQEAAKAKKDADAANQKLQTEAAALAAAAAEITKKQEPAKSEKPDQAEFKLHKKLANSSKFEIQTSSEQAVHDLIIKENTKSKIEVKGVDYYGVNDRLRTGVVETWGPRDKQEDRIVSGRLAAEITDQQASQILTETIAQLQKNITNQKSGSCLNANIVHKNKIYNANLGDSTSYLVIYKKDGSIKQFKKLNEHLHKPNEPKELKRIQDAGGDIFYHGCWRVDGLAIARAIGDNSNKYVSHEPDITKTEINAAEGEKAILITACDGLTEKWEEDDVCTFLANKNNTTPEDLALELADEARNKGSKDNISVMIKELYPNSPALDYQAVFDGHGGDEVSEFLYQNFPSELEAQVKNTLNATLAASAKPKPQEPLTESKNAVKTPAATQTTPIKDAALDINKASQKLDLSVEQKPEKDKKPAQDNLSTVVNSAVSDITQYITLQLDIKDINPSLKTKLTKTSEDLIQFLNAAYIQTILKKIIEKEIKPEDQNNQIAIQALTKILKDKILTSEWQHINDKNLEELKKYFSTKESSIKSSKDLESNYDYLNLIPLMEKAHELMEQIKQAKELAAKEVKSSAQKLQPAAEQKTESITNEPDKKIQALKQLELSLREDVYSGGIEKPTEKSSVEYKKEFARIEAILNKEFEKVKSVVSEELKSEDIHKLNYIFIQNKPFYLYNDLDFSEIDTKNRNIIASTILQYSQTVNELIQDASKAAHSKQQTKPQDIKTAEAENKQPQKPAQPVEQQEIKIIQPQPAETPESVIKQPAETPADANKQQVNLNQDKEKQELQKILSISAKKYSARRHLINRCMNLLSTDRPQAIAIVKEKLFSTDSQGESIAESIKKSFIEFEPYYKNINKPGHAQLDPVTELPIVVQKFQTLQTLHEDLIKIETELTMASPKIAHFSKKVHEPESYATKGFNTTLEVTLNKIYGPSNAPTPLMPTLQLGSSVGDPTLNFKETAAIKEKEFRLGESNASLVITPKNGRFQTRNELPRPLHSQKPICYVEKRESSKVTSEVFRLEEPLTDLLMQNFSGKRDNKRYVDHFDKTILQSVFKEYLKSSLTSSRPINKHNIEISIIENDELRKKCGIRYSERDLAEKMEKAFNELMEQHSNKSTLPSDLLNELAIRQVCSFISARGNLNEPIEIGKAFHPKVIEAIQLYAAYRNQHASANEQLTVINNTHFNVPKPSQQQLSDYKNLLAAKNIITEYDNNGKPIKQSSLGVSDISFPTKEVHRAELEAKNEHRNSKP